MLVIAGRLNHDRRIVAAATGINEVHRRGEVLDVQLNTQLVRQAGIWEVELDATALLLHVDPDSRITQVNDDITGAVTATLKVQAGDSATTDDRTGYRRLVVRAPVIVGGHRSGGGRGCRRCRCRCTNHHVQVIAFGAGGVGRQAGQIDDQAGTVTGLNDGHAPGITQTEFAAALTKLVLDAWQVQRDPRRLVDGVTLRRAGDRLVEAQFELYPIPRQRSDIHTLQISRKGQRTQQ